jgi:hypothetical protein
VNGLDAEVITVGEVDAFEGGAGEEGVDRFVRQVGNLEATRRQLNSTLAGFSVTYPDESNSLETRKIRSELKDRHVGEEMAA